MFRTTMRRIAVVLAAASALSMDVDARADEAQAYPIVAAVKFGDDPLFTRVFKESVLRQTAGQLALDFGSAAEVNVTAEHPAFARLGYLGLDGPVDAAELVKEAGSGTLFLITVDFQDGQYEVAWRQITVDWKQVGPVRKRTTTDREWVAKAVCLAVKQDFAPTARLTPRDGGKAVLDFRGAPGSLEPWLKPPCVFRAFRVEQQRDGSLTRTPISNTLVLLVDEHGKRETQVVSNLAEPFRRSPRTVGFEAMKLTTQPGRLRVKVVDVNTGNPALGCAVFASDQGFDAQDERRRLAAPNREGLAASRDLFQHVAFVSVVQGESVVRVPTPILEDWTELTLHIPVDRAAGEKRDFERRLGYLVQDLQAGKSAVDEHVAAVNDLHQRKRFEEALKRAELVVAFMGGQQAQSKRMLADLQGKADALGLPQHPLLAWAAGETEGLAQREVDLRSLSESLQAAIDKISAQSRADVLLKLGLEAERNAEIEEAISKYTLALGEQPDQPEIKERLEKMQATWAVKSPDHQAARDFVYKTWPSAELTQIDGLLSEAQRRLTSLEQLGDQYTIRKLALVNAEHLAALTQFVESLADQDSAADRAERDTFGQVAERVVSLQEKTAAALETLSKSKTP